MMISTRGRYALRLMIDIARQGEAGALVTMRQAAEREDLSVKYLEQLGGALVKAGVLKSVRGVSGGYLLARPADQITAGDVLRATEGSCAPVSCLEDGAEACPRRDQCVAINFWRGLDQAIEDYVDNVTLADLVQMGQRSRVAYPRTAARSDTTYKASAAAVTHPPTTSAPPSDCAATTIRPTRGRNASKFMERNM